MNRSHAATVAAALTLTLWTTTPPARAEGAPTTVPPAAQRFADEAVTEVPDFQRHVLPLLGRLGCNTRSCHGSFQGRGGFRLSLFGYDFKADHDALFLKDSKRVDLETPELSKVLQKPTLAIPHKGGKRLDEDSWSYRLLVRWLEAGGKGVAEGAVRFERLEVTPTEIVFDREGRTVPLKVVARWADGTAEDVTCITRFRTNDESVAEVGDDGVVTSKGTGDTHVVAFYDNGVAVTQVIRPVSDRVGSNYPDVPTPTTIDALVVAKLKKLGIVPSEVCTDGEFLRRVSLDLTGTLPSPTEVEAFLADPSPAKRSAKVDELLARPTYSAYWATRLCDLTADSPRQFNGIAVQNDLARHWYEWVERRVRENTPYDKIVAGLVLASSRKPGQSYDDFARQESSYVRDKDPVDFSARDDMPYFWARRNLNTPDNKALAFSYTFLGVRLECSQCHKHPFDQWTQDDFKQFTAFFTPIRYGVAPDSRKRVNELREELGLTKLMGGEQQRAIGKLAREGKEVPWQEVFIVAANRPAQGKNAAGKGQKAGANNRVITPKLLGGEAVDLASVDDPRKPLMNWLRSKDNPYFARAWVNRVWANHFGKGIVNPPDDMNLAAPPSNAALLDHLANGFVASGYDLKWLHREILTSATYQRGFRPNATNRLDEKNFSRAVVRRLPAEVLLDAVQQVSGSSADLAQASTRAGLEERAIGPKGGAGLNLRRGGGDFASKVFGRSPRETNCDCQASIEPNLLQSIYLQNDFEIATALNRPGGWVDERTGITARNVVQARTAAERQVETLKRRIAELEKQKEAFARADKDKAVADMDTQLAARRDDLKQAETKLGKLAKVLPPPPFDGDAVVREAFLRALSRRPTDAELTRSRDHLAASGDNAKGLRDLLWALLNTKEFSTNH
jgi:hypothetical protein